MFSYENTFATRVQQYMYAIEKYPHVMQQEFNVARDLMRVRDDHQIVHVQAGGIPLFKKSKNYHTFETSPQFVEYGFKKCTYNAIELPNQSMDRGILLASLHHASIQDRRQLYSELRRIIRPGGRLVIGDVEQGSQIDRFLNEFVDQNSKTGHDGLFFTEKDAKDIQTSGWKVVEIVRKSYKWVFQNEDEMVDFATNLFDLQLKRDDLLRLLPTYLNISNISEHSWDWELLYFICE